MRPLKTLALVLSLALAAAPRAAPLTMVIDSSTSMPIAELRGPSVVAGMNYELGHLLAERLGRSLQFTVVPRKRLVETLSSGEGDLVCMFLPAWLPGPLQWSRPFFRQSEVVASRKDVPAPEGLNGLAGQAIGTVHGFVYVELEAALGPKFVRADAPNAAANLRKLAARRLNHVAVESRLLRHMLRSGEIQVDLHPTLHVYTLHTQCALGPKANLSLAELDQAIERLEQDGSLAALYKRYD